MSIRLLAKDLYRLQREVEALERKMASASLREQAALEARLRETRAERDRLRGALDGQKDAYK
jgi:uncharacterized protein YlxW (UPF0749 family)